MIKSIKISFLTGLILLTFCTGKRNLKEIEAKSTDDSDISFAKRIKIEKKKGYSLLYIINPWQGANKVAQTWYLVPEGTIHPVDVDPKFIINVPVKKIICMSTTHLSMISALDEINSVKGFSGTKLLFGKEFAQKADSGKLLETGYDENLNKELILKIEPDLVMVYGVSSESSGYIGKLKELGIKVMYNADYLEDDPLGKAEWLKLFGALYCKENLADSIFRIIERNFYAIRNVVSRKITSRPNVLLGLPFRDTWYISPGNTYIAALIEDAGGRYLWNNTRSSFSMPLSLETVYLKALDADYWLNIGTVNSKDEIVAIDARFASLPCFKNGNLYNNNERVNLNGGNDYWESGSLHPDMILADIASILHPDIFPGQKLTYYKKLK